MNPVDISNRLEAHKTAPGVAARFKGNSGLATEDAGDMSDLGTFAALLPYHGKENIAGAAAALLSSAKFLKDRFVSARCDSPAVSECVRCNAVFLAEHIEKLVSSAHALATLKMPAQTRVVVIADTSALSDIAAERQRQIDAEGWTPAHDDAHDYGELARAAACYAVGLKNDWPWSDSWWKPKDRRTDLVRAGALIVAEIERLDRADGEAA